MYIRSLLITVIISFSLIGVTFATEPSIFVGNMPYSTYLQGTKDCDNPGKSWNTGMRGDLIPEIDYPELTAASINTTMKKWQTEGNSFLSSEKAQLEFYLDPVRIGNFSGFKALEVARIGYRVRMNQLFTCAILASRMNSIDGLQSLISKKIKIKQTEITKKLQKERLNYAIISNGLRCYEGKEGERGFDLAIVTNSAAHQYCHYRYYLDYLDSNTANVIELQRIEQGIGTGSGTQIATDIAGYAGQSNIYSSSIAREITRADTTLPKALSTFIEMDQTYQIHILLADFIYDDYMNLRKSLSYYMNLSSQLYQKAYNAQSTNK